VIASSAGTGRSVYQISMVVSDPERVTDAVARIFCPDPDHAPPCPVPWESCTNATRGSVGFTFYATGDQARGVLAEVTARGFGEVRLFKSTGEDSQPIDGSTVIEQFHVERDPPES
jgi:hypothetical protein